jgi:hypothetical protein
VKRYQRRPLEVEAVQLPPLGEDGANAAWAAIATWCGGHLSTGGPSRLFLNTPDGRMWAGETDWIFREPSGGFRAVSREVFERDFGATHDGEPDQGEAS